jgi:hypothetical protein
MSLGFIPLNREQIKTASDQRILRMFMEGIKAKFIKEFDYPTKYVGINRRHFQGYRMAVLTLIDLCDYVLDYNTHVSSFAKDNGCVFLRIGSTDWLLVPRAEQFTFFKREYLIDLWTKEDV